MDMVDFCWQEKSQPFSQVLALIYKRMELNKQPTIISGYKFDSINHIHGIYIPVYRRSNSQQRVNRNCSVPL